jgi:HEAT repeat protein
MAEENHKGDTLSESVEAHEVQEAQETLDPHELKSVKDLLQSLTKTAKTVKIYLANNPIHQKFLKELTEKFSLHLKEYGSLTLTVQQYQLLYEGEEVYENTNRLESIAFRLHIDGMREITFQEGLEEGEILSLIEVISRDYDPTNPNDDMVTLLWEKNLPHVSYAIAENLFDEGLLVQTDQKKPTVDPGEHAERQVLLQEEIQKAAVLYEAEGIKRFERPYSQVFQLTEEEVERVKKLMEIEEKRDLRLELIGIVGSILSIEKEDQAFEDCLAVSDRILKILIAQGDFSHTVKILEIYRGLLNASPSPSAHHQVHLQKALEWVGGQENFAEIERLLKVGHLEDTESFSQFLALLYPNAIPSLVELLGTLNQMKARRLVCEALVVLGKDNQPALMKSLNDPRWFVIRNLVYVLGKIGDPKVLEEFKRLSCYPDARVRKEVLQALSGMPQEAVQGVLLVFLKDPDWSIRQQVLRWFSASGSKEGLKRLQEMVEEGNFKDKEFQEKQEVFDSIARIGADQVVNFLKGFLGKRGRFWFSNQKEDELSLCAVAALKRIGSETSLLALEEGMDSHHKVTREACRKALMETRRGKIRQ